LGGNTREELGRVSIQCYNAHSATMHLNNSDIAGKPNHLHEIMLPSH